MKIFKIMSFLLLAIYINCNEIQIHQVAQFVNLPFGYSMQVKYNVTYLLNKDQIYKFYTPGINSLMQLRHEKNSFLIRDEEGTKKITLFENKEPIIEELKKDYFEQI